MKEEGIFITRGTLPFYSMDLLSLRLVGEIGADSHSGHSI